MSATRPRRWTKARGSWRRYMYKCREGVRLQTVAWQRRSRQQKQLCRASPLLDTRPKNYHRNVHDDELYLVNKSKGWEKLPQGSFVSVCADVVHKQRVSSTWSRWSIVRTCKRRTKCTSHKQLVEHQPMLASKSRCLSFDHVIMSITDRWIFGIPSTTLCAGEAKAVPCREKNIGIHCNNIFLTITAYPGPNW